MFTSERQEKEMVIGILVSRVTSDFFGDIFGWKMTCWATAILIRITP
jgi:hypothetical protein